MDIKEVVKNAYGRLVKEEKGCCGSTKRPDNREYAKTLGYSELELKVIPDEANFGLSCGNPTAMAGIKEGETVLDLGSGAGFDCFLAASIVGRKGRVIGVDMTPEMLEKARENANKSGFDNVEFRFGEIENLPVEDNSVDLVISNCVINLSADKPKVFSEIYRVLKPGGRVAISDIALLKELPQKIKTEVAAYVSCISGAVLINEYERLVSASGLKNERITVNSCSPCCGQDSTDPFGKAISDCMGDEESLAGYMVSVNVEGYKL